MEKQIIICLITYYFCKICRVDSNNKENKDSLNKIEKDW